MVSVPSASVSLIGVALMTTELVALSAGKLTVTVLPAMATFEPLIP